MFVPTLLSMFFLHIVDDYYLQGILAQLKQKSWWNEHAPDPMYRNDFNMALFEHAFSWAFMIMIPLWAHVNSPLFYLMFVWNWLAHATIDNLKANRKSINLVTDQSLHFAQILFTYFVFVVAKF